MALLTDSILLDIITIFTGLLGIIYTYFKISFTYWQRQGVPQIPPEFPFGNTKSAILQRRSLGETILDLYKIFRKQGKRFGGIYMLSDPQILLIDPELVKNILSKDFKYFSDRGFKANEETEPLTGHLLNLNGVKWKNLRQKLTPTFTSGKMKMMFQTLVICCSGLETILEDHSSKKLPVDIKEIAGRFTTDIIGSCAFGLECNSLKNPDAEFRKVGKKIFTLTTPRVFKIIIGLAFPNLLSYLKIKQFDDDVTDFFMKVVADTINYREQNNIQRNDFLQLLINIKNTGDVDTKSENAPGKEMSLTVGEMAAQCFIFFLAGFETSSTTMTFFLFDMAMNQEVQDKVRKEVNDMLKRYDGEVTYDGVMELQYMEKAIYESMRYHSSIPLLQRRCVEDYKIPDSDVVIKKGTSVNISVYGLHSDPEYYPDPEKYDPERFSAEEKQKRDGFTFLPFGEGPRICIGQRFGMMQTKVGLVSMMRNHRFTLSKKTKYPLKMVPKAIILTAVGGIWLDAERI